MVEYQEALQNAYQPYITGAGAAGFAPGAAQMGETAATDTLGGVPSYLTQAGAYSGPTGYEDFMSPYQQDVIDATLWLNMMFKQQKV